MRKNTAYAMILAMSVWLLVPNMAEARYMHHEKDRQMHITDKFFMKAHFILENKDEIGLTEEQVDQIVDLKVQAKKELIRKEADIEILGVDFWMKLKDNPVDVEAVNGIVDQKYELKKDKTKSFVGHYAKLKGILTEDQMKKVKELWYKK